MTVVAIDSPGNGSAEKPAGAVDTLVEKRAVQMPEESEGHLIVRLPDWNAANKCWDLDILGIPGMKLVQLRTKQTDPSSHGNLDAKWKAVSRTLIEWLHTEAPPRPVFAKLEYSSPGLMTWFRAMDWKAWIGPVFGLAGTVLAAWFAARANTTTSDYKIVRERAAAVCKEPLGHEVVTAADVDLCLQQYRVDLKDLSSLRTLQKVRAAEKVAIEKIETIPLKP